MRCDARDRGDEEIDWSAAGRRVPHAMLLRQRLLPRSFVMRGRANGVFMPTNSMEVIFRTGSIAARHECLLTGNHVGVTRLAMMDDQSRCKWWRDIG